MTDSLEIQRILALARRANASDIHIVIGVENLMIAKTVFQINFFNDSSFPCMPEISVGTGN